MSTDRPSLATVGIMLSAITSLEQKGLFHDTRYVRHRTETSNLPEREENER